MKQDTLQRIEVQQGDITKLKVDAIVNAANNSLLGGGGVDGAIHRAAGSKLLEECKTVGGCPTGDARLTKGYNLPARYVIHTVGPVYRAKPDDPVVLSRCYQCSLKLADDHQVRSIAFPAISCGVYGYPIEDACKIAMDTTVKFLEKHLLPRQVIFVLFSLSDFQIYQSYLRQLS